MKRQRINQQKTTRLHRFSRENNINWDEELGLGYSYIRKDNHWFEKLEDWENKVKVLYDLNPGVKLILSGSASLNLISFTRFGTA